MFLNSELCKSCGIKEFCSNRNNGCSGWRSVHEQKELVRVKNQKPFTVQIIKESFSSGIALWQNNFVGKPILVKDCALNTEIYSVVNAGKNGLGYAISKTDCKLISYS